MSKVIRCAEDLIGSTLEYGDRVYFGAIYYQVESKYLSFKRTNEYPIGSNASIFEVLGLKKNTFCSEHYRYPDTGGGWPECNNKDMDALTRVILALYEEISKLDKTHYIKTPIGKDHSMLTHIAKVNGRNPEDVICRNLGYYIFIGEKYVWQETLIEYPFAVEYNLSTIKTLSHESKFQRKKARIKRGTRPKGSRVCGKRSKTSVVSGHLSYRKVIGF